MAKNFLVDRNSLHSIVTRGDVVSMHAIGRALVHLFNRQTRTEQARNDTEVWNEIGFTGADGRSGCITAKYYIKHGSLLDWQIDMWTKTGRSGYARIAKYWKQINEEAEKKAAIKNY